MRIGTGKRGPGTVRVVEITVLVILALSLLGGWLFIRSGVYPIAATEEHLGIEVRVIEALRDHSVQRYAADLTVPDLEDRDRRLMGAVQYDAMCVVCHGAPGQDAGAMAEGLMPRPPRLDEELHRSAAEQFWITREGLKFTGMPGWGPTHNDEELWAVVALLQIMP